MAVTSVSLLLLLSLALPEQESAIPSSSLDAKAPEAAPTRTGSRDSNCCANWDGQSRRAAQTGLWVPCMLPAPLSPFLSPCSQRSGPSLPKEPLNSNWKVRAGASPSSSRLAPPGPYPRDCNGSVTLLYLPCECHCTGPLPSQHVILMLLEAFCLPPKCSI